MKECIGWLFESGVLDGKTAVVTGLVAFVVRSIERGIERRWKHYQSQSRWRKSHRRKF